VVYGIVADRLQVDHQRRAGRQTLADAPPKVCWCPTPTRSAATPTFALFREADERR
jgi:hypothetical protein